MRSTARMCASRSQPAAAVPQPRAWTPPRPRWRPTRRASSGRCTTSCSATSRSSTRADLDNTRRRSASTWRSTRPPWTSTSTRRRSRPTRRPARVGARRHAGVLHQRPSALGRAAVRRVQGDHRRGDQARRRAAQERRHAGQALRRSSSRRRRRAAAGAPPPRAGGARGTSTVAVGNAPVKGPKNAPVTIVSSATSSARSARASSRRSSSSRRPTRARSASPGRTPLPFHQNAQPAAEAALAAREQGKFWEMHDKLFANQQALDRPALEEYAQELGPQHGQVQGGARRGKFKDADRRDNAEGDPVGASGTPTFFINGAARRRAADRRLQDGDRRGARQEEVIPS